MDDNKLKQLLDTRIAGIIAFGKNVDTQIKTKKEELVKLECQKLQAEGRLQAAEGLYCDIVGVEYCDEYAKQDVGDN